MIPWPSQTKRLKSWYSQISCLTLSALKKDSVEIGRQVRLLCPWARHLTVWLYLWVVRLEVTGGSLTRRPKRSLRCLLADATWQINEQNCKSASEILTPLNSALILWMSIMHEILKM